MANSSFIATTLILGNLSFNSSGVKNSSKSSVMNDSLSSNGSEQAGSMHPLYIALYVFAAIFILPGLVGNGLIIAAVSKLRSLKTPTNYLISNLAVADLVVMFVMVFFLMVDAFNLTLPGNLHVCFFPSMDICVASASIMSLAAVSFDRGLAVLKPLQYERLFFRKRALHIIACIWSYVAFIFVSSLLRCKFTNKAYQNIVLTIAYVFGFVLPCGIVAISYTVILLTTIRVIRMSRKFERSLTRVGSSGSAERRQRTKRVQLREAKVAVNFMLILVPFLLGWGFYFGTFWSEHIKEEYMNRSPLYEWFLLVIPWFISSINPIVYILFTMPLRQGCKKLFQRFILKKNNALPHSVAHRMFSLSSSRLTRRKSSVDSQSRSLLSLFWVRAKRSSSASETATTLLPRLGIIVDKEENDIPESRSEKAE